MKMHLITIGLWLLIWLATPSYAGFDEGYAAFKQENYAHAHRAWKAAAAEGSVAAKFGLGILYANGLAVAKNPQQALFWFNQAAEQGNAPAQFQLGSEYYTGRLVSKDLNQAAYWITQAAKQGYAKAEFGLGCLYYEGAGVTKDYQQALSWFREAGKKRIPGAIINIGGMYAKGIGVPRNLIFAYAYFSLAARIGGTEALNYKTEIQRQLGSADLVDAQILAESWMSEWFGVQ